MNRISPQEVAERLERDPRVRYVDVRSVREFEQGHPPGAINVPLSDHDASGQMVPNPRFLEVMQRSFPRDAPIVTGCAMGGRSLRAAQMLAAAGFTDVADMIGGFSGKRMPPVEPGWVDAGLPVRTDGVSYRDVLEGRTPAAE